MKKKIYLYISTDYHHINVMQYSLLYLVTTIGTLVFKEFI